MYKAQRILMTLLLLIIALAFYGCDRMVQRDNKQKSLETMLRSIKNYEADVVITFLKEEQENILEMKQKVELGGKYELHTTSPKHLKGYITSFDGEHIKEYNPITKAITSSKTSAARNETMLANFIQRYIEGAQTEVGKMTLGDREVTILTVDIPGDYRYLAKQRVYFDENKKEPIKMEIYDNQDNKAIQVEFTDFKYNIEIRWET